MVFLKNKDFIFMKQGSVFVAIITFLLLFLTELLAQQRDPKIGYVYPAGGQRGTTFQVLIGGRQIARCKEVVISGNGVQGRVFHGYSTVRINDSDERRLVNRLFREALAKQEGREIDRKESHESKPNSEQNDGESFRKNGNQFLTETEQVQEENSPTPEEVMKKYPFLDRLTNPTQNDLERIFDFYFAPRPERKPVEALGQAILAEITIDDDAEPGDRDIRLLGQAGMTPPVRFMVGVYPEIMEREPNDPQENPDSKFLIRDKPVKDMPKGFFEQKTYDIPVVLNGQIRAGDIDRFQFTAKTGQKLVIDVRARHLIPYLADAVPGWFQPVVSLYNSEGTKIDEAMSWRYDVDPLLLFDVPKDGIYTVEIQDSIFRGRDDFVYRIIVAESPLVMSMFPLGVRQGYSQGADIEGWNIHKHAILLDGEKQEIGIYEITQIDGKLLSRPIRYEVDNLPEIIENEPNNGFKQAKRLDLPVIVNGRIENKNDVDCFMFEGKKNEQIVLDVSARTLDSPIDAAIELFDEQGKLLAINDDRADSNGPNIGLETHHADPYLSVDLPADGNYFVRIYEVAQQGGKEFSYRLRISRPRPDFTAYCEPSGLAFRGNDKRSLKINIVRKDGFKDKIKLHPEDPTEFQIENDTIASESNETTINLIPLPKYDGRTKEIQIKAVAMIDGKKIMKSVIAIDDMEQAFIYHHWVPAASLTIRKFNTPKKPFR